MVKYIYGRAAVSQWIQPNIEAGFQDCTGVLLRKTRGDYATAPESITPVLMAAVQKLNVEIAFTMRTEATNVILATLESHQSDLVLTDGSQIQVVDSLEEVATTNIKKFQYACLVRQERMMLVWHDDLQQILPHVKTLEEKFVGNGKLVHSFCENNILMAVDLGRDSLTFQRTKHTK
jgi:hypothetical protein